jgi:glycosyltransferase involved in cell wall biosynthesis
VRILHVITKLDVGGAQSMVAELAEHQVRSSHHVLVASGLLGPVAESLSKLGIAVERVGDLVHPFAPHSDWRAARIIRALIHDHDIDVVHCHSSKGGLVGRIAARRAGVPSVYTAHGWPFQPGASRVQQLQSVVGEFVGALIGTEVVCVNNAEQDLARRLHIGRPGRVHVIPNGIGHRVMPSRTNEQVDSPFELVTIARLAAPKRIDLLIEAVRLVGASVRLTVVGDGPFADALRAHVVKVDGADRVSFVGNTDPEPYLAQARLFVFASDYEGSPVTVLEAMRAGLPVLSNRLPGVEEQIGNDAGIVCALEADAFAKHIDEFAANRTYAYETGLAARRRWEQAFTAQSMAQRYEDLYRACLSRPSA